jgi:hypothetical protein
MTPRRDALPGASLFRDAAVGPHDAGQGTCGAAWASRTKSEISCTQRIFRFALRGNKTFPACRGSFKSERDSLSNDPRLEARLRVTAWPGRASPLQPVAHHSFFSYCPRAVVPMIGAAGRASALPLDYVERSKVSPRQGLTFFRFAAGIFRSRNTKQLAVELILRFSHQRNSAVVQADKLCVVATAHPPGCVVSPTRLAGVSRRAPHKGSVPLLVDPPASRGEVHA